MKLNPRTRLEISVAVVSGTALGCLLGALVIIGMEVRPLVVAALAKSPTPTATSTPTMTPTATPTRTSTPTLPPTPTDAPTVTSTGSVALTPPATPTPRPFVQHFLVGRPVGPDANRTIPDPVYLYGTTEFGQYDVHHGEDFDQNPIGTPLYAVADGTVVVAGNDKEPICGNDGKSYCGVDDPTLPDGFYGNLVVIELAQEYQGQPVFALYGHMSKIDVSQGDAVKKGMLIGEIGDSGVAVGPHVHFEIRLGVDDYYHTRNPILWMTPLPGYGSLAGRFTDAQGKLVRGAIVNIYRADATEAFVVSTETYSIDKWPPVNSDEVLGENFAVGDLPVGDYIVRIAGQPYARSFKIQNGKLTFVELGGS